MDIRNHLKPLAPLYIGYLSTIVAAIIWGINGTMVQYLVRYKEINIEWLVTVRLMIPGVLLLGMLFFSNRNEQLFAVWKNRKDALALIVFSIALAAVQYTFFAAIKASNAAVATILQFSAPVMVTAYYALIHFKMPSYIEVIAVLLALIGTFLLATKGQIRNMEISSTALFWGLASAVALAFYSIQPTKLLSKYRSTIVVAWGMLIGSVFFSFIHAPWRIGGVWDGATISYFTFIILLGSLVAFSLYLRAVKLSGAYITTLLTSIEPLTATIISVLWLQVAFGLAEIVGGICIISTIFILTLRRQTY